MRQSSQKQPEVRVDFANHDIELKARRIHASLYFIEENQGVASFQFGVRHRRKAQQNVVCVERVGENGLEFRVFNEIKLHKMLEDRFTDLADGIRLPDLSRPRYEERFLSFKKKSFK